MKTNEMVSKVSRTFYKAGFGLKKHSPEILVIAGVIGTVVSAVMACKATTKINDILDETKEELDTVHKYSGDPDMAEKYSVEDAKKDTVMIYTHTGMKLAKLYGPAICLGVASISSILVSNNILRKRNAALAAAYAVIHRGFKT